MIKTGLSEAPGSHYGNSAGNIVAQCSPLKPYAVSTFLWFSINIFTPDKQSRAKGASISS